MFRSIHQLRPSFGGFLEHLMHQLLKEPYQTDESRTASTMKLLKSYWLEQFGGAWGTKKDGSSRLLFVVFPSYPREGARDSQQLQFHQRSRSPSHLCRWCSLAKCPLNIGYATIKVWNIYYMGQVGRFQLSTATRRRGPTNRMAMGHKRQAGPKCIAFPRPRP